MQKLANGALYKCWTLTDLQQPEPREVVVHIMGQAFHYFNQKHSGQQEVREPVRGEVVALCNAVYMPVDLDNPNNRRHSNKVAVRIVGPDQVRRFGTCPTLGRCDMRGCKRPCNKQLRERFCALHLATFYHEKSLRMTTGGHSAQTNKLVAAAKMLAKKPPKKLDIKAVKQASSEDAKIAAERKVETAVALEKRRLLGRSATTGNYIRAVQFGAPKDGSNTSLVPELGRGLEHSDGLDVEMDFICTDELTKAERMLSRRTEEKQKASEREAQGAPAKEASVRPPAEKRLRTSIAGVAVATGETVAVKNLGELMRTKLKARRAGATPAKADDIAPSLSTHVGSWKALEVTKRAHNLMAAIREGQHAHENTAQAETAPKVTSTSSSKSDVASSVEPTPEKERASQLEIALHDTLFRPDRLSALLSECSAFFCANGHDTGLYNTAGILGMTPGIPAESKQALMNARRQWRSLVHHRSQVTATPTPARSLNAMPICDVDTATKVEAPEVSTLATAEAQCLAAEAIGAPAEDQPCKELAGPKHAEASDAPVEA